MKNYVKNGAKVLFDYAIVLVIFCIFIYVFMSLTKDNFNEWLPFYCFLLFLIAFLLIYTDMKSLAMKEKKPQYELNPYPFKGLVYGMIGVTPIALIVAIAALIQLNSDITQHLKHVAINIFLGPMYFVIRWLDEAPIGYIAAIMLLPLIAMLGYLAGYYGINIMEKIRRKKVVPEKGFIKSPWNPTNASGISKGKKKKKRQNS